MKTIIKNHLPLPRGIQVLVISLILLGIFFRLTNLDQKYFDGDECISVVRAAGYSIETVTSALANRLVSPVDFENFRRIPVDSTVLDTLRVTAAGAPQHTPLFFVLTRYWIQLFDNSVVAIRAFTALTGVLVLPAIYWLSLELFSSPWIAGLSMGLTAVSPLHLIHAQNARPRTLWILMIVVSSAALLRALKLNRKGSWILYGLTLSLHLYTFLFSIFVVVSHGIYVVVRETLKAGVPISKRTLAYLLATACALGSFIPWAGVIVLNVGMAQRMTAWTSQEASFFNLLTAWMKNICDIFLYWHVQFQEKLLISEEIFILLVGGILVVFTLYAFYFLCRTAPLPASLFVLSLAAVPAVILVSSDLLLGGIRSALVRYLFPCVLSVQLAIAYLLAIKCVTPTRRTQPKIWQRLTVLLLSLGVLSCSLSGYSETWNGTRNFVLQSAQIINQADRPLVISNTGPIFGLMPLTQRLDPQVRVLMLDQAELPPIPEEFSSLFLYSASPDLIAAVEAQTERAADPVYQDTYLNVFLWQQRSPRTLWKIN